MYSNHLRSLLVAFGNHVLQRAEHPECDIVCTSSRARRFVFVCMWAPCARAFYTCPRAPLFSCAGGASSPLCSSLESDRSHRICEGKCEQRNKKGKCNPNVSFSFLPFFLSSCVPDKPILCRSEIAGDCAHSLLGQSTIGEEGEKK